MTKDRFVAVGAVIFVTAFSIGIAYPILGCTIFFGAAAVGGWLNWRFWHFVF